MSGSPDTPATVSALAIEGLLVRYLGTRRASLEGISASIEAGQLVAVTGPTGAGKSTLALAAAGFIPRVVRAHVEGTVTLGALAITQASAAQLAGRVGIVFSTPAHQLSASKPTVREELAFGLENLGMRRAEMDDRIDEVMGHLGIGHLADREPLTLSGGEQQRVAIASIVAMGTDAIVLDEPTAQLDPGGTLDVATLLQRLAADGRTVLCTEQDAEVLGLARRCLLLDAGRETTFDIPGRALGSATLAPLGLRPPSMVALAEAANVPAESAFDELLIADALRAHSAAGSLRAMESPSETAASIDLMPMRENAPASVRVSALVHDYPGGVTALRGVDLEIDAGERVAIVGQNGSGKTTLVKHLNGLLRPGGGNVFVGGRDIGAESVADLAATVGFVFQSPDDQLFERSVEREVGFGPANLRLPVALRNRLVDRALEVVGLVGSRASNPYDLGAAERKFVALASVLAMDPAVLILDEPTSGQDAPGVDRIADVVAAWAASGRAVIAVTHDMDFAARAFGRIVVMRAGEVILDGPPESVFQPENHALLESAGLRPPAAARVAARLHMKDVPLDVRSLLASLNLEAAAAAHHR